MMPAPAIANAWSVRSLRREDMIVVVAMAVLVVASWLYLIYLVQSVPMTQTAETGVTAMTMAMPRVWTSIEVAGLVVMWSVMMIAMMIPTAAPMILVFAAVHRRRATQGRAAVPTAIFVLGYVIVWTAFSVAASLAQAALHAVAMLSPAMATTSPLLGGALLVAAGVFQWTPLKRACLAACRTPLSFLMHSWREGSRGALVMGLQHGLSCLGCCWALMSLLFVAGVMNLLWVAVIALAVLAEKVLPYGDRAGRLAGAALVIGGLLLASGGM